MREDWAEALGCMTYGIYVLTARFQEDVNGMIASWVSQVSYEPPLLMAAIHQNRYAHGLIEKSGHFALHLIPRDRKEYLPKFKKQDPAAKFQSIDWKKGKTGCPIILDCICYFECALKHAYRPGNHTLFIGEVVDAGLISHREPLTTLDYEGVYLGKA